MNGETITTSPPAPCRYCGGFALLRDSRLVWPLVQPAKPMWFCQAYPACDTYVRCHDGGTVPMGTLANERLRKLRSNAHQAFDPLWQEGGKLINRAMAYMVASRVMGIEDLHIGHMDEDQSLRFIGSIALIEDALTAFAHVLLNPRNALSEPELDVLEAVFSEDYGRTWLPRIPAGALAKTGPIADAAIAAGLVRIDEDTEHRDWAVMTPKGRGLLAGPPERRT